MLKIPVFQSLHHRSAIFNILLPTFSPSNILKDIDRITHDIGNVINRHEAPILNSATEVLFLSHVRCSMLGSRIRDLPVYVTTIHMKET
jgi:hypothetical protein